MANQWGIATDVVSGADTWQLVTGIVILALIGYLTWHYLTFGFGKEGAMPVYPFVGILPSMQQHQGDLFDFITEVLQKSPTMSFFGAAPGIRSWLFTANPAHIQHILKDNFSNYPKGQEVLDTGEDFLGRSIFMVDGEEWKLQRKMASYEFSTNSLRNMMKASIIEELTQRLIPTLDSVAGNGKPVDMQDVLLRFTFDNICRIGFGVEVEALTPKFLEVPFAKCVDRATELNCSRMMVPGFAWKLMRHFKVGFEGEFIERMAVVNGFVNSVIAKRRSEVEEASRKGEEGGAANDEKCDLLSRMIALGEKDHGQVFSDSFLRDSCLGFLIAGRDTTAVSISWFLWHLIQHPEVEQKILEELDTIMSRRASNNKEDVFTFEEIKQMTYVHAAINESMRLRATVPLDQKVTLADDAFPDGTFVPRGTIVTYSLYSEGRLTKVWGEDALEYKPERWIAEDGQLKVESPFKFAVFNAGPRLCLGKDLAYMQMKSVVASILRRYKLALVPRFKPSHVLSLTLLMKEGLPMTLTRRN